MKKTKLIEERDELRKERDENPDHEHRDIVEDELRHAEKTIKIVSRAVRD